MNKSELIAKIKRLKAEKNAVILAHYYQREEIQEVADFIGDSYALALRAAESRAEIIVFAGVHFMAETAKILNPERKVLLPDLNAGCSLAESCEYEAFAQMRREFPDHVAVTYINCSAAVKTLSDIVCTSSNAEKIIRSLPENQPILFAPDKNLGKYLERKTGRKMKLWDGACVVHEAFSFQKLLQLYFEHPEAEILAHPESEGDVLQAAHFIGSTSAMIDYASKSNATVFIVATEVGILNEMKRAVGNKQLIPAPSVEENTCSCSECAYMKVNTLQKLYDCLKNESPEIFLDDTLIDQASLPIHRMIQITEYNEKV